MQRPFRVQNGVVALLNAICGFWEPDIQGRGKIFRIAPTLLKNSKVTIKCPFSALNLSKDYNSF